MVKTYDTEQTFVKTHFVEMNLCNILDQLGEDETKNILSSFSCPINKDIENFIKYKAIEFSKRTTAKTHLVFWETEDKKNIGSLWAIIRLHIKLSLLIELS